MGHFTGANCAHVERFHFGRPACVGAVLDTRGHTTRDRSMWWSYSSRFLFDAPMKRDKAACRRRSKQSRARYQDSFRPEHKDGW
jgi:hypothetical protein